MKVMKGRDSTNLFFRSFLVVACFLVIGCPLPPPPDPLFSFVIIADPHLYGGPGSENAVLLSQCVNWVNTNQVEYQIRFASIVGDIAWGDGFQTAKDVLEDLSVPWIPVIGDNVIQSGEEADFDSTWASQYAYLASVFDNWQKNPTPVWNPELG